MKINIRMKRNPNSSATADNNPRPEAAEDEASPGASQSSQENGEVHASEENEGGNLPGGEGEEGAVGEVMPAAGSADTSDGGAPASEAARKVVSERDQLLDRLARLQAEFDNYRKRSQREQAEFKQYASTEVIRALLPVLDNFELALKTQASEGDLRSGIELIRKQLYDVLARQGLEAIPASGEAFDPHIHEGIEMVETDEAPDNTVLEELQPGYRFKNRMLRPAMVRVARNSKH